jgi:hypothetical protein
MLGQLGGAPRDSLVAGESAAWERRGRGGGSQWSVVTCAAQLNHVMNIYAY